MNLNRKKKPWNKLHPASLLNKFLNSIQNWAKDYDKKNYRLYDHTFSRQFYTWKRPKFFPFLWKTFRHYDTQFVVTLLGDCSLPRSYPRDQSCIPFFFFFLSVPFEETNSLELEKRASPTKWCGKVMMMMMILKLSPRRSWGSYRSCLVLSWAGTLLFFGGATTCEGWFFFCSWKICNKFFPKAVWKKMAKVISHSWTGNANKAGMGARKKLLWKMTEIIMTWFARRRCEMKPFI